MEQSANNKTRAFRSGNWIVLFAFLAVTSCQSVPTSLPEDIQIKVLFSSTSASSQRQIKALRREFGERMKSHRVGVNLIKDRRLVAIFSAAEKNTSIIAIGDRAARVAKGMQNKPVYISQYYDPRLIKQLGVNLRGVSILPDARSVFWSLRSLDPSASRIGIITGPGLTQTISKIEKTAAEQRFKIVHRIARTDRGFLYEAERMSKGVDVYWLFPDDRILSSTAIKRFMRMSVKEGKRVIAFTPALLKLGALLSLEPDETEVAKLIKQMIITDYSGKKERSSEAQHVKKMRIRISKLSADRLGVKIPKNLQRFVYE